ncbi:alpha/beta hydrolase fold domain-containing protein [Actinocorallia populi]|uniref:alpha/beta hydrolase fold domain-containing protein n=1 Tax=Actinocorallia populi TaxID=2079200 RepID=UPI000D08F06C|nr:alpha/beta hydrolase fold domain-containing protein [Actinocorallia populi]
MIPPEYDLVLDDERLSLRLRIYPADASAKASGTFLLWLHGGGFVGGSLDMPESDAVCAALAKDGITCVAVEYRLAPNFGARRARNAPAAVRFPLPLDDCERAWQWVRNKTAELGIDPERMHVGGASAGGALASTLVLRLLRGNARPPAGVVLAYPLLHPSLPPFSDELRRSLRGFRRLGTFTAASVRWMARNYVGRDGIDRLPEAFPGGADLGGFPPALIVNSERDTLRASGEAFADELRAHGRPVEEGFEPGTSHGHLNRPQKPEFHRSIRTISSWLSR